MKGKCKALALSVVCAMTMSLLPLSEGAALVNAAENIITNGTFDSGTKDWAIYRESGGKASLSTDGGRLAMTVTSIGTVSHAVQLYYDIVPFW